MNLIEFYDKVKVFDIRDEVLQILRDNTHEMEELNRGQFSLGVRTDNSEILPSYTDMTIAIKKEKGQPFDHVYLKDSGDFWRSLKYTIEQNSWKADDTDWKTQKLEKKYNTSKGKILGLTDESKKEFTQYVFKPELQKVLMQKLGLLLK